MKRQLFKILALAAVVLLANRSAVKASDGDCHIYCCDSSSYVIPTANEDDCCELYGYFCGYRGEAYRDAGRAGLQFCSSIEICTP